ncbi:MAG: hypothetical protein JO021_04985 [Alphaproteobacteria bacterium]|nr:hypothetical protein [Alphaproteobacteria bacterium]
MFTALTITLVVLALVVGRLFGTPAAAPTPDTRRTPAWRAALGRCL